MVVASVCVLVASRISVSGRMVIRFGPLSFAAECGVPSGRTYTSRWNLRSFEDLFFLKKKKERCSASDTLVASESGIQRRNDSAHLCDVKVVRSMRGAAHGEREGVRFVETASSW